MHCVILSPAEGRDIWVWRCLPVISSSATTRNQWMEFHQTYTEYIHV